ncbi:MAG: hypothetical protein KGO23_06365 [Nitrospirota bacterium]|nr:hypothetical protein [Nitrospirota bacterium]
MGDAVPKVIECSDVRNHPLRDVVKTPNEVQLLDKIKPFEDEMIECPEGLRLPELRKSTIPSKEMPSYDAVEVLIHQHVLKDHRAADNLVLGELKGRRATLMIDRVCDLIGIKVERQDQLLDLGD